MSWLQDVDDKFDKLKVHSLVFPLKKKKKQTKINVIMKMRWINSRFVYSNMGFRGGNTKEGLLL